MTYFLVFLNASMVLILLAIPVVMGAVFWLVWKDVRDTRWRWYFVVLAVWIIAFMGSMVFMALRTSPLFEYFSKGAFL